MKENKKEIIFIDILIYLLIQFAECNEDEAIMFSVTLLEKLEQKGIKIK